MAKYKDEYGNITEVVNPELNPNLITGKTLVSDTTPSGASGQVSSYVNPNFSGVTTGGQYANTKINSTNLAPTSTNDFATPSNYGVASFPPAPEKTEYAALPQETEISNLIKGLTTDTLASEKEAYKIQQEQTSGLEEMRKAESDYTAQYKQLEAEYKNIENKMQLEAEGRGITTGGLAPITASEQRKVLMKANTVSALLAGTQGKIAYAESQIDRAVANKFGVREAERKAKLENLDILSKDPTLTVAQQKRALDQTAKLKKEEEDDTKKKEDTKTILDWAVKATQNGATPQQAQAIANIGLSDNPDLTSAFNLYSPFSKTPEKAVDQWSDPYMLGGDYVQKNIKTGEIRTAVNVPVVTKETPLSILDIARYNEIYPEAGITAGDTEKTANEKVAKLSSPEKIKENSTKLISGAKANRDSYETVVSDINSNPQFFPNKEIALQVAAELYGKSTPSKVTSIGMPTGTSTTTQPDVFSGIKEQGLFNFLFSKQNK